MVSTRLWRLMRHNGCNAKPAIPSTSNEAPARCPHWIHRHRNEVVRPWARLKEWRAVATRYEKPARSFLGVLCLLATTEVTHGLIRKDGENRGNGCNSQDRPEPNTRIDSLRRTKPASLPRTYVQNDLDRAAPRRSGSVITES
jgi:hypothetical protein